ncbi:hypothetical protein MK280_03605, partial [Myxococcota bacterium]|nr:hypothetical protein [Myxococcota bacterium]
MRHLLILAGVAISFLISASMASAFSTSMARIDGGPDTIEMGDTVELQVDFDTEGANEVQVLSVSVLFDPTLFTYSQGSSLTPTYALYNYGGRGNVSLAVLSTNMSIRAGTDYQILLDWSSTAVPNGTRDGCGNFGTYPAGPIQGTDVCGFTMARLVFQAIDEGS